MNDLINNNTKPENITELFEMFKKILNNGYVAVTPINCTKQEK